jgi:hypothetical protein
MIWLPGKVVGAYKYAAARKEMHAAGRPKKTNNTALSYSKGVHALLQHSATQCGTAAH